MTDDQTLRAVAEVATREVESLRGRLAAAEAHSTVPGMWRCAKCKFVLVQSNLNARDGSVTARDDPGDRCPNDGSPLWRMSWKDRALEAEAEWEKQVDRAVAAETRATTARADGLREAYQEGHRAGASRDADLRRIYDALPRGPRCRDCADEDGRCPSLKRPCDPTEWVIELIGEATAIRERAASVGAGSDGWEPIETAPKDGKPILVWAPDDVFSSFTGIDLVWFDHEWLYGQADPYPGRPTLWRLLPEPPRSAGRG